MNVAKELRKLSKEPLDGIVVNMNEEDVTDVTADIVGPGEPRSPRSRLHPRLARSPPFSPFALSESTPFQGGIWKVKLVLPADYPHAPPKGASRSKARAASPLPREHPVRVVLGWEPPRWSRLFLTRHPPLAHRRLLPHEDLPPEHLEGGRDLREHS